MAQCVTASANRELDEVLELLCEGLQLTPSEWSDAEEKYSAVGRWLSAPGSPLYSLRPEIKYQGSMLLGTVVKPWIREEFDVDLLAILATTRHRHPEPTVVYEAVASRIAEHDTYRKMMTRKERCIELNYAGQFHLDVVPAIPESKSGNALLIPDRQLRSWVRTDPFGYAQWFYSRTPVRETVERYEARANVAPLPPPNHASDISPLQRTVQLIKRRRDLFFDGSPDAPKSIALTTLAANHYDGQSDCTDALIAALGGIRAEIDSAPGILSIPNPVDRSENLARHWTPSSYGKFIRFVDRFIDEMHALLEMQGWDRIRESLEGMFGDRAGTAVEKYAKRVDTARRQGKLGYGAGSALLTPATAPTRHVVPRNEFYGR